MFYVSMYKYTLYKIFFMPNIKEKHSYIILYIRNQEEKTVFIEKMVQFHFFIIND